MYLCKRNPNVIYTWHTVLRQVLRSVALQVGQKFVCSRAMADTKSTVVKDALHLLSLAGLVHPVVHTAANKVLPVEVKASTQGSMQSLWIFLRMHGMRNALRTSLENFGQFDYYDSKDNDAQRHVDIIPLYAISNIQK